jgi:site-specific DNA-methyltransferase (adenine-specific)
MIDTILVGDCCEVLSLLPSESVDLIVADPPYNIGVDYGEGRSADRRDDYWSWCSKWIWLCGRVLKPHGSIWIISGQEHGAEIDISLQLQQMTIRNRITWHETFGVYCHRKFGRTSRPIYYAVKDAKRFTFNREAVLVPSARQTKYRDRRAASGGKIMGDVWQVSRVCGTFHERIDGVPTQLPMSLVERIVGVSSNPGDVVLDPFAGSGTVPLVARQMGRRFIGIEKSREFAAIANSRLLRTDQPGCLAGGRA